MMTPSVAEQGSKEAVTAFLRRNREMVRWGHNVDEIAWIAVNEKWEITFIGWKPCHHIAKITT